MKHRPILLALVLTACLTANSQAREPKPFVFNAYDNPSWHTEAVDADRAGHVVGHYLPTGQTRRGFIRDRDGRFTDFALPSGEATYPVAMNVRTVVGGPYPNGLGPSWTYDRATGIFTPIVAPGEGVTYVTDINEDGVIVGYVGSSDSVGFILRNGEFEMVTTPGFSATRLESINDKGQIGGGTGDGPHTSATFIRQPDGTRTPFNVKTYGDLITMRALDGNGNVASACDTGDGVYHTCVYSAAKKQVMYSKWKFCPTQPFDRPNSMKRSIIVGMCYGPSKIAQGYVINKAVVRALP